MGPRHTWKVDCLFCGCKEFVQLVDVWGSDFQLATCCEASHEAMTREMADDPDFAAHILRLVDIETVMQAQLRRVAYTEGGAGSVLLDFHIDVRPISRAMVVQFVAKHHAHNRPLTIDRFSGGIYNGATLVGVVQVGNPCARAFNDMCLEVRRLCLDRTLPQEIRWKACSAGYGWAASEAEKRGWSRIITYTLASEDGMSLRYSRWKCEGSASRAGHAWPVRADGRVRHNAGPLEAKVRWAKKLHPTQEAIDARTKPRFVPLPLFERMAA